LAIVAVRPPAVPLPTGRSRPARRDGNSAGTLVARTRSVAPSPATGQPPHAAPPSRPRQHSTRAGCSHRHDTRETGEHPPHRHRPSTPTRHAARAGTRRSPPAAPQPARSSIWTYAPPSPEWVKEASTRAVRYADLLSRTTSPHRASSAPVGITTTSA